MQIEHEPEDSEMLSCLCEQPDKALDELGVWFYEKARFRDEGKKVPTAGSPSALKTGLPGKHIFEFLSSGQVFALKMRYVNDYCMN